MNVRRRERWIKGDFAIEVELKFVELNNCCGMGALDYFNLTYKRKVERPYNKQAWISEWVFDDPPKRHQQFLPQIVAWFEDVLEELTIDNWSTILVQVVDYSKEIQSDGDAGYHKDWNPYGWLTKLQRRKNRKINVDWSKSYENHGSGNHLKVAFVTER